MLIVAHFAIERENLTFLDPAHPGDKREQRGLADTVRPDETDHAIGGYFEATSSSATVCP